MTPEGDREWYQGESPQSFAAAARIAVERAEEELGEVRKEYDVRLQVLAEGPLSGYRVLVSPTG
jgi:flavin-binding protein dodecin